MLFANFLVFISLSLSFQGAFGSAGVCGEWSHHTYGKGITCCQHKAITPGIGENEHWTECIKHPTNEKENFTVSIWRVYTCALEKSLPKGQKTITLTKFAELMTAKYPDDIKKKINDKVKEVAKNDGKTKKWLTADVKLTDLDSIDKLRADYFNIEKKECGGLKELPKGEEKGKNWKSCCLEEESIHRAADCCGNITVPFVDHHHNKYQDFKPKTCEKTLQKKLDKTGLKDKEDKATFLEECQFGCYLIEKKLITIDHLVKVRVTDEIPSEKIVKEFVPVYLSQKVQKDMQAFVKSHLNRTYIMQDFVPNTMLGEKVAHEELYGCYAYAEMYELIASSMFQMCHPDFHIEDNDY